MSTNKKIEDMNIYELMKITDEQKAYTFVALEKINDYELEQLKVSTIGNFDYCMVSVLDLYNKTSYKDLSIIEETRVGVVSVMSFKVKKLLL